MNQQFVTVVTLFSCPILDLRCSVSACYLTLYLIIIYLIVYCTRKQVRFENLIKSNVATTLIECVQ